MIDNHDSEDTSRHGDKKDSHGARHASEEVVRSGNRAFDHPPGDKEAGREVSDEEREGVPSTDTEARSARGVGPSESRSAEEIAAREKEEGRETTGTDRSGRPHGVSHPEDTTGVGPPKTTDRKNP